MKRIFVITLLIFLTLQTTAQNTSDRLTKLEDSLVSLLSHVHQGMNLKEKLERNELFEQELRKLLRMDEAFKAPLTKLSNVMSTIKSPDDAFRMFNWNVERNENGEQIYFCLIMKYDKRKEEYITIELFDKSKYATRVEFTVYNDKKWFGALYYDIVPVKKGAKTIYTLMGWDGNNSLSNKKIIETMAFQGSSKVKFGFPLFKMNSEVVQRRVIFQYKKESYMSVKHHVIKKQDFIIFDHLLPEAPQLEGIKDFYVSDLSFDAFYWESGKWRLLKDIDIRTGKSKKDRIYHDPRKDKTPLSGR